jgi:signal transduction histidine kinase
MPIDKNNPDDTPEFAPTAQPLAVAALCRQQEVLFANSVVSRRFLDAIPNPLLVINQNWQVVYANNAVLRMFDVAGRDRLPGLSAGEAFHCLHSRNQGRASGGNVSCQICGVARAVVLALQGRETVSDCRLSCDLVDSMAPIELRVWATPLESSGEQFSILVLNDIGQEKRRAMLADACFHDLLNTLTSIRGLLDVLKHTDVTERPEICELLEQTTLGSIEEIMTLRLLEQAEEGLLTINWAPMTTGDFVQQQLKILQMHPAAQGKQLCLEGEVADVTLRTDRNLLRRVIGNMVLNALEATDPGGTVTLGCRVADDGIEFRVHNDRPVPLEIQTQIFTRSFSTKGDGRGFGTFSVQMLSSMLRGKVGFVSSPQSGTTFQVIFPLLPTS